MIRILIEINEKAAPAPDKTAGNILLKHFKSDDATEVECEMRDELLEAFREFSYKLGEGPGNASIVREGEGKFDGRR